MNRSKEYANYISNVDILNIQRAYSVRIYNSSISLLYGIAGPGGKLPDHYVHVRLIT